MLTIEANPSNLSESKLAEIFIKQWSTHFLNNIYHTDITTIIQGIAKIMPTLTFTVIEVANSKVIDFYFTPILIHHVWFYLSCVETYGDSESFKYTSRLIGRGQRQILMCHESDIIFVDVEGLVWISKLEKHGILIAYFIECHETIFKKLFYCPCWRFDKECFSEQETKRLGMISRSKSNNLVDISWSIWIKSRIAPDGSDGSSKRIHHDSRSIIGSGRSDTFFEGFHEGVLDIWIYREVEIDTFNLLLSIFIKYWTTETIASLIFSSRFTSERIIEISLNTESAYTVTIDKSCHLCERWSLWILTD